MSATVQLGGAPYVLRWDKGAIFRADELGVWGTQDNGMGFSRAAKYLFAMLPDAARRKYTSPERIAEVMPPLVEVLPAINAAIAAAGEDVDPKKLVGSTNGLSPESS